LAPCCPPIAAMCSRSPVSACSSAVDSLANTVLEMPASPVDNISCDRKLPCKQGKACAHDEHPCSATSQGYSATCWTRLRDMDEAPTNLVLGQVFLGFGQVVFCGSKLTGLCHFGGLFLSDPWLAVLALVGCMSATCTGNVAGFEPGFVQKGMAGYNGVLVGCAFAVFISPDPWAWRPLVATAVGGCFSAFVMVACGAWSACPAWTFPFNIVALSAFLYAQPFGGASPPPVLEASADWSRVMPLELVGAVFRGLAQIFVAHHWATGLLVAIGCFWHSPRLACILVLGSALGLLSAFAVQADVEQAMAGLWGFNPALTAAAACTFFEHSYRTFTLVVWSASAAALLAAGLSQSFSTAFKMPAGTLPFCLVATVAWGLLDKVKGYKKKLVPGSSKELLVSSPKSTAIEPAAPIVTQPKELMTTITADARPSSPLPVGPTAVAVDVGPLSPTLLSPSSAVSRRTRSMSTK